MWGLLRIVLLIANAVLLVTLAYLYIDKGLPRAEDRLPVYGMTIFLALNFIYLLLANQPSSGRVFRLIGLWFDAKESELRQRAKISDAAKALMGRE